MNLFQKIYKNFISEFGEQDLENFLDYVYYIMFVSYIKKTLVETRKNYFIKERNYKDKTICVVPWEIPHGSSSSAEEELELDIESTIEDVKLFNSFQRLTYKQKVVLYDYYLEEKTEIEISMNLNITRQAVNRIRTRAINSIKKFL